MKRRALTDVAHLKIRTGGFLPHTRWFVRSLLDHRQAPRPEERQKKLVWEEPLTRELSPAEPRERAKHRVVVTG